jgi:hypothetical protein
MTDFKARKQMRIDKKKEDELLASRLQQANEGLRITTQLSDSNFKSSHKKDGWKSQYARMCRWHQRLSDVRPQDEEDFLFAFYMSCYHMRDWLCSDNAIGKSEWEAFLKQSIPLQRCRDLCNGAKHMNIRTDRESIDRNFMTGREYCSSDKTKLFFWMGTDKVDAYNLAADCKREIEKLLKEKLVQ